MKDKVEDAFVEQLGPMAIGPGRRYTGGPRCSAEWWVCHAMPWCGIKKWKKT